MLTIKGFKIESYEDACAAIGIKPLTIEDFSSLPEDERQYHYSQHRLLTVHSAFHAGRTFDWEDVNQRKFLPVWDMETYGDGRKNDGCVLHFVNCNYGCTSVGSRLCSFSTEEAEYIAEQFIEDYRNIIR